MIKQILQVREFQQAVDAPLPVKPTLLPRDRAILRHKLLQEEVDEFRDAFKADDIVGQADAVIDCMYILIGTAHELGFADRMENLFDEVHRSNMSKMNPETGKPTYREDGKVLKPETYSAPNLSKIMDRDFSVYKAVQDNPNEGIEADFNAFIKKVNKTIGSNLKLADRARFENYLQLEKHLAKKVNVNIVERGINNKAFVKVYDKEIEVNG